MEKELSQDQHAGGNTTNASFREILEQSGVEVHGSWTPPYDERGIGEIYVGRAPLDILTLSPFSRPVSLSHVKGLSSAMQIVGVFLDPLLVVRTREGKFWIVNGQHRYHVLRRLGVPAAECLFVPESGLATLYLYLNVEKVMQVREKVIVVARMWDYFREHLPTYKESELEVFFEAPEYITMGLCIERGYAKSISASLWRPVLKGVDSFFSGEIGTIAESRESRAKLLAEADLVMKAVLDDVMASTLFKDRTIARAILMHEVRRGVSGFFQDAFTSLINNLKTLDKRSFIERLNALAVSGTVGLGMPGGGEND